MRPSQMLLLLFLAAFALAGCERTQPLSVQAGDLQKIELSQLDGIPTTFGELVDVTTHAQYEGWSQLWFVDEENTIRMVRVEFHANRIHENVLVIPRN